MQGVFASPISVPEDTASSKATSKSSASYLASQAYPSTTDRSPAANPPPALGLSNPSATDVSQTSDSVTDQASPLGLQPTASVNTATTAVDTQSQSAGTPFASVQYQSASADIAQASVLTEISRPPQAPSEDPSQDPQPFGSPSATWVTPPLPAPKPIQATTAQLNAASPDEAAAQSDLWNQLWDEPLDLPDQAAAPITLSEPQLHMLPTDAEPPSSVSDQALASTDAINRPILDLPGEITADTTAVQQQSADLADGGVIAAAALLELTAQPLGLPNQAAAPGPLDVQASYLPDQDTASTSFLYAQSLDLVAQLAADAHRLQEQSSELPDRASIAGETLSQPSSGLPTLASPSVMTSHLPNEATTPRPFTGLPGQATPSYIHSSLPDQASTSELNDSLPDLATLPHIPQGASGWAIPATPKTAGTREYGSWWTPKGLTPVWMKAKTPAWVKKMRQPDMVGLAGTWQEP